MQSSIYHQLAKADGVSLEPSTGDPKAFSIGGLSGDYRRIIYRPANLQWKLIQYSDPNEPLTLSELEALAGAAPPQQQGMLLNSHLWLSMSPQQSPLKITPNTSPQHNVCSGKPFCFLMPMS